MKMVACAPQLCPPSTPMYARLPDGTQVNRPREAVVVPVEVAVDVPVLVTVDVPVLVTVVLGVVVALDVMVVVGVLVIVVVGDVVALVLSHPLNVPARKASKREFSWAAVSSHWAGVSVRLS